MLEGFLCLLTEQLPFYGHGHAARRRARLAAAHALQQQLGVRLRLDDLATGVAQVKSRFGRANLQKPKSVVNTY